jgi:hypothetical protein
MRKSVKKLLAASSTSIFFAPLISCTSAPKETPVQRAVSSLNDSTFSQQPPLEQGEIWTQQNMQQAQTILEQTHSMLAERAKDLSYVPRDAHPKHHGCATAEFKIDASALPAELQVGVFSSRGPATRQAWVRFSNGSPNGLKGSDVDSDVRGMAVKLLNVEGTPTGSQDFVMMSSKEFFSVDESDYLAFHEAVASGTISTLTYFGLHGTQRRIVTNAKVISPNPLQIGYFSAVPYKLGPRTMKFKVVPCAQGAPRDPLPGKNEGANFLRERLVHTLAVQPACFDFFVQPNMDPEKNKIENATLTWAENVSPYVKVATLTIAQQTGIDSQSHLNFCENLSYDPWHALPATRPMGQINRTRLLVYSAIAKFRHDENHTKLTEPTSLDICRTEADTLCAHGQR